jgi:hypothetical protein
MKFRSLSLSSLLFFILFFQNAVAQQMIVDKKVEKTLDKIKPDDIKAHIQYLADDRLQGRAPGSIGYQMAVDYVISQFKSMGIKPGGENGSYLQKVIIRRAFPGKEASMDFSFTNGFKKSLTFNREFVVYPHHEQKEISVQGELVFAGYGISAPEIGYDDYEDLDVKGKIVVVLQGAPDNFHSTISAHSKNMGTILQNAIDHGAKGVIIGSAQMRLTNFNSGLSSVVGADGKVAVSRNFISSKIEILAMVNDAVLRELFDRSGLDLDLARQKIKKGETVSAPLTASIQSQYTSSFRDIESYNVIGKIEGSDPLLKHEYVVHSAHLDHLGISTPVKGDSIYNGAHDNASGVASLLEIARIHSRIKPKAKRSILIVMVTAEEMGLLGSAYFAKVPTVPQKNIVANINTDMPTIIAPLLSVVALGAEHSSLEENVKSASAYMGMDVENDPEPEQNRFIRSDQYSFVAQGIPALHIKYGNKTTDGKNNLDVEVKKWREIYYHKPQDDINGTFDFEAGKKYAQLNFLIGYSIANQAERPQWKNGDFFGLKFGGKYISERN